MTIIKEETHLKENLEGRVTSSYFKNNFVSVSELQKTTKNYKIKEESKFYRWACNCVWAGCIAGPVFTLANVFILSKYSPQANNFGDGTNVIPFILGSFLEASLISGTVYYVCRHNKRIQPKVSHAYQHTKKVVKNGFNASLNNVRLARKSIERTLASAYHYLF